MKAFLIRDSAQMICASIAFVYGSSRYLKPRQPIYAIMSVLGLGCAAMGRLYQVAIILTETVYEGRLQIGILGMVGMFAFLFSSNYGEIDSLVDDGSQTYAPYRRLSFAMSCLMVLCYIWIASGELSITERLEYGVVSLSIAAASYYHIKHILIPDVEFGIVRSMRAFNVCALLYGLLCILEIGAALRHAPLLLFLVCVPQCVLLLAILPLMDVGVRSWTK